METNAFSKMRRTIFGVLLLGYSGCSSSTQEKEAAYQTIKGTFEDVCSYTRYRDFELSRTLLFCGQDLCYDKNGVYLPKPGEECTNQMWGARYGWSWIKSAHSRNFRQGGCVDVESVNDESYSPRPDTCAILTHDLQQAKTLADAINVYID